MNKVAYITGYLLKFFEGDESKVEEWMSKPNRNFGFSSPQDVIDSAPDGVDKVYNFIKAVEEGY